jgi:hypothetical protein
MPAVGLTPGRTVIAENVCDLQSGSSHGRRRYGGRRLRTVSLCTPAAQRAQTLQRALDLGNQSDRHATVAGCRLGLAMSEQRLNQPDIHAALEQMGRKAVAKRMQRDRLAQRRGLAQRLCALTRRGTLTLA